MGVAAADYDNDGFVDLYRTGLSGSVLLHNNGNGTFTDVTAKTGAGNPNGWGVSAAFVDYDRDGWLDLFVGNYLLYSVAGDIDCLSVTGQHDYCPPNSYRAQPDRLYHNRGNGTFEDVTSRALVGGADGPALGVSTADFDGDGWIDIYVGNDGQPNQLWINQKNGTFKDTAFISGAAVNGQGNSEASMGVDAGDYDNDGDEDIFITNWLAQMNILYVNMGGGVFEDRKAASGLGPPSLAKTGFGAAWFDYDNDSWLDLLTANGSVSIIEAQARVNDPFPLKMLNQLYRNLGNGRFEDVSAKAGKAFTLNDVSRGAAFGDIDNDGDEDVVIGTAAGPARLLINNVGNKNHWVGLRLRSGAGTAKRDQIGARVEVIRKTGGPLWRRARSDGSYASANDPRVLVGLGASHRSSASESELAERQDRGVRRGASRSLDHADRGYRLSDSASDGTTRHRCAARARRGVRLVEAVRVDVCSVAGRVSRGHPARSRAHGSPRAGTGQAALRDADGEEEGGRLGRRARQRVRRVRDVAAGRRVPTRRPSPRISTRRI